MKALLSLLVAVVIGSKYGIIGTAHDLTPTKNQAPGVDSGFLRGSGRAAIQYKPQRQAHAPCGPLATPRGT